MPLVSTTMAPELRVVRHLEDRAANGERGADARGGQHDEYEYPRRESFSHVGSLNEGRFTAGYGRRPLRFSRAGFGVTARQVEVRFDSSDGEVSERPKERDWKSRTC